MILLDRQVKILELAGKVQYIAFRHLMEQGIFEVEVTARNNLKDLVRRGFLNAHTFGVQVGAGRLPSLYGLTPAGQKYLVEQEHHDPDQIKTSKSHRAEMKAPRDFHHRIGLIDSMLALHQHLDKIGAGKVWTELYFRKHGMHEPKRTAIELEKSRLEPDAILHFHDPKADKTRLYLVEFYEDSEQVERIRRALRRHEEAIHTGSPSEALGLSVGHRVLLVFRHDHTARAVMRFLREDRQFAEVQDRFLTITLEALKKDPFGEWASPEGKKICFG
jgi:hypothetical protein